MMATGHVSDDSDHLEVLFNVRQHKDIKPFMYEPEPSSESSYTSDEENEGYDDDGSEEPDFDKPPPENTNW